MSKCFFFFLLNGDLAANTCMAGCVRFPSSLFFSLSISLYLSLLCPFSPTAHIDSRIGILAHHRLCLLHIVALWLIRIMCYLMSLLAHVSV